MDERSFDNEEYLNRSQEIKQNPYGQDFTTQHQDILNKSFDVNLLNQSQNSIRIEEGSQDGEEPDFFEKMLREEQRKQDRLYEELKQLEKEEEESSEENLKEETEKDKGDHSRDNYLGSGKNQIKRSQKSLKRPNKKLKVDELDDDEDDKFTLKEKKEEIIDTGKTSQKKILDDEDRDEKTEHYRMNDLKNPRNRFKDKHGRPVREAVERVEVVIPRQVPAELTWDEVNAAAREFFYIRQVAYDVRRKEGIVDNNYNPNARWSDLSMNQKIKRKRKGEAKRRLRNQAIQFANNRADALKLLHGPDAQPPVPGDPSQEEIDTFLAINLDAFHVNNDQEFITHLVDNYALTDRIEPMEQLLERVVTGESELPPERVEAISRQIAFLKELKEWMDARLELISDPYYVLLSSRELTDSAEVLQGLTSMEGKYRANEEEDREALPNVKAFLTRYERVKACSFNRRRLRNEQDLTYREEFRELTDEKGDMENAKIVRRKRIREEKETREGWQRTARESVLAVKEAKATVRHEPATVDQFLEKSRAFLAIDLKQFHFGSIEDILKHHRTHDLLFEQAREMQRILTEVSQEGGAGISVQSLISVRARLALFAELRRRQTKTLLELTKRGDDMENMSPAEWTEQHDLVLGLDPSTGEQKYLQTFSNQNDEAENRIQEMYAQLKPGQAIPMERINQVKKDFQRNLLFWESIKAAKMELSAQDDETRAFLNSYYRERNMEVPAISKHLLIHLRGKSKADTEEILRKYAGTPAERMQLEKEIADQALAEVKHLEEFRVNPDNTGDFLRNIAYKLHRSEMIDSAAETVAQIDQLHTDHPDVPVPEGYVDEYRKELMALSEFAQDHIDTRMKVMTDVADQVDTAFLGSVDIREFKSIKEDRDAIRRDLEAPAEEQHTAAKTAARVLFDTADKLFKNVGELEDLVQGERQRVASADTGLDAVYQTYRLANGIQEKVSELEAVKKQALREIEKISENPIYSSREELQTLRDFCISALSEHEKDVPEHLYYDLTTPVLKNLAVRKLRDSIDGETIRNEIKRYQEVGIQREKEEEQPEWGEKEKNAILLMGNLAGMEEKKEEDGEDLLSLLDAHAEIIADMARVAMSDEKKKKADMKRYRELKQKIEIGENLDAILEEEEEALREMEQKKEIANGRDEKDKKYVKYLESQVQMHKKQVASIQKRREDWNTNQDAYRKELNGLACLDTVQKEIEEKERALKEDCHTFKELKEKQLEKSGKGEKEDPGDQEKLTALQKEIKEEGKALEMLKKDPRVPLDVFGSMSRRLEGLDGSIAKEIGAALSDVVNYLVQKSGDKVLKLRSVRNLLKQKDPSLTALLRQVKSRIRTSMDNVYQDVCKEVREVTPFMFENLDADMKIDRVEGYFIVESTEEKKKRAYYQQKYEEKDAKEDQEEEKRIREEAEKALHKLADKQKDMDPEVYSEEKKKIEIERDRKLGYLGPDGRFLKQASELYTIKYNDPSKEPKKKEEKEEKEKKEKKEKKEITLQMLHNQNWAYDPETEERPGEGAFVRNVMQNYFEKVGENDKRFMLKTMFFSLKPIIRDHRHVKVNTLKQTGMHLAGLLRGAGPLLQKLMQGVPQHYLMTELCEAVEDMKSNLEPIPDSTVKEMFEKMKTDSKGEITEIKKLQSLGAASVGQTFLCRIKGKKYPDGKQVVIKILRPNAGERIAREEKIMKDCAKATGEGMLATYEGQLTKVREELKLTKEAENVRAGIKAYELNEKGATGICKSVHVMEEIPPTKEYLVLDKAEGETFDRYLGRIAKKRGLYRKPFRRIVTDPITGEVLSKRDFVLTSENGNKIPEIRQSLVKDLQSITKRREHLEKVTELWIRESVMKDGFYHGDMHAGNLMADERQATILDYGNATKLNSQEVKQLMALYAAAMYGDARLFLDTFLSCLPREQLEALDGSKLKDEKAQFERMKEFTILKNRLRKKLFRIFRRGTESETGDKVDLALTELQKYGLQIPISLYSYVQSQMRLNNTLEELNEQELGLRNDIRRLDLIRPVDDANTIVDLLMQAQLGAIASQNQEEYYRSLVNALQEPDEKEFLSLLADTKKGQDGKTDFERKYMGMFDRVNKVMSGKATYETKVLLPDDIDDEGDTVQQKGPRYIPIPVINVEEWKKEYEDYLLLLKADQEQSALEEKEGASGVKKGKSEIHDKREKAGDALQEKLQAVFQLPDAPMSNGLMGDFGNHYELLGMVGEAILGKRSAFDEFVTLIENGVKPLIVLARDLHTFLEKGKKTGAKELFRRYKHIAAIISERHKVIADIRGIISYDRRGYVESLAGTSKIHFRIEDNDTTQFKQLYPAWRKLFYRQQMKKGKLTPQEEQQMNEGLNLTAEEEQKMKEPLTPEEEQEMDRLWKELLECRKIGVLHRGMKDRMEYIGPQIEPWFLDKEEGKALYSTYTSFCKLRDADMAARDLKWDDDTYLKQRVEAESKFLEVYRRAGCKRVKEHLNAFALEVPPQKNEELRDFNTIFEGVVKSASITQKMDKGALIGLSKAYKYSNGTYVGGLDLEDSIPQKPDEKVQILLRDAPWSLEEEEMEEEQERKKERKKRKKKEKNRIIDENRINEEPRDEFNKNEINEGSEDESNDEDNPNLIITMSSKNKNEIIE